MPELLQIEDTTPRGKNEFIGLLHAQGYSQNYIAKQVGLSQQTISRRINNDEVCQAIVEQTRKLNAQLLPKAFRKHETLLTSDNEKIALSAVELTYKTTGILQSRTGDQYFIQHNTANIVTPDVAQLFSLLSGQASSEDDVIDTELLPDPT